LIKNHLEKPGLGL